MTKIITATEITDGQIENAVNKLRDAMRKHRSGITSDLAQRVLGIENLGMTMFAPFRERAEVISRMIIRKVTVDRRRTPQEALDATGFVPDIVYREIVDAIPKGRGDEVEVMFFKPDLSRSNGSISNDDLEKMLAQYGLKSADPISVAAVNEANPTFAELIPNGTHWKDKKGNWCDIGFTKSGRVSVRPSFSGWHGCWWIACVRK